MTTAIEREVKLRFASVDDARTAIAGSEATPIRSRRLQEDYLLDEPGETLKNRRCVLRVRIEPGKNLVTFKGPVQPSHMKVREELETVVGDGETMLRCFEHLGYRVWFRYQKYREEYALGDAMIAIDETPVGVFVEVEGSEQGDHRRRARARTRARRLPARFVPRPLHGTPAGAWPARYRHAVRRDLSGSTSTLRSHGHDVACLHQPADARRARALGRSRHAPATALAGCGRSRRCQWPAPLSSRASFAGSRRTACVRPSSTCTIGPKRSRRPWAMAPRSGSACATRGSSRSSDSGGGPARAFSLVDGDELLIVNGDTLTDIDLRALYAAHAASDALVTMAVIENPAPLRYGGVQLDASGAVERFTRAGPRAGGLALRRCAGRGPRGVRRRAAGHAKRERRAALPRADRRDGRAACVDGSRARASMTSARQRRISTPASG